MHKAGRELCDIRSGRPEDEAFIYATWLNGQRYGSGFFREIEPESYFSNYKRVIASLLAKSTVHVACLRDDADVILGYSVCQPKILHWVFVKEVWRRFGLAKDLIPKDIEAVTHMTAVGRNLKPKGWKFDPFLI